MKKLLHSKQFLLGAVLLLATSFMTVFALVTDLGSSVQYVTFISHLAILLTAVQIIQLSVEARRAKVRDPNDPTE